MKLYTRTGDDGSTALFDGGRVPKCDLRVEGYGNVDELNAFVGVAICGLVQQNDHSEFAILSERLKRIQNELFDIGADLATPMTAKNRGSLRTIGDDVIAELESWIDEATQATPELHSFVLPGGSEIAAHLHVCRTVCRRAERSVVLLSKHEPINDKVVVYLNRLSDLLFAWSRWTNHVTGDGDVEWKSCRK